MNMKKMANYTLAITLILTSFGANAELPSARNQSQYNQPYNQQYNQGSNQYNYPNQYGSGANMNGTYGTPTNQQPGNSAQRMYNNISTGKDLLWMFTSDQSTFGKRLFFVFSQVLDRRFLAPIENRIGNLEANRQQGVARTSQPAQQGQGVQYCYDCVQQNNTNPYARNPNAVNPAIFNANGPSNSNAGGIQK